MHVQVITDAAVETNGARIFDSVDSPANLSALAAVERSVRDADLAAPPVVLPDFHHKSTMEMPSSTAVATLESIRPTLTSASLNCGMALLTLDAERPDHRAISNFFHAVRERHPFPARHRRDLTANEVIRCAARGADFACERFDLDPAENERVELGGTLDLDPYGGIDRVKRELPWSVVQLSRMRFGTIGPKNHFVELQEVEEILDPRAASVLGVQEGQLTLQYHCGGGVLAGELGALFGRRKRFTKPLRAQMSVTKPIYHLGSAQSPSQLRERLSLYFSRGCPPVPRHGTEGQRLMLANALAMNYGFAYRLATYASLRAIAKETLGAAGNALVVDSPHNSIYEEEVSGENAVVHRHNSCRAYPADMMLPGTAFAETGQALLLPGTNRTSSYLCVAGENTALSLYSACHGAGSIIDDFAARELSGGDPHKRTTLRFRYSDGAPAEIAQLDDRGVNEALRILTANGLARPVARMRPIAVLN